MRAKINRVLNFIDNRKYVSQSKYAELEKNKIKGMDEATDAENPSGDKKSSQSQL